MPEAGCTATMLLILPVQDADRARHDPGLEVRPEMAFGEQDDVETGGVGGAEHVLGQLKGRIESALMQRRHGARRRPHDVPEPTVMLCCRQ